MFGLLIGIDEDDLFVYNDDDEEENTMKDSVTKKYPYDSAETSSDNSKS